MSEDEEEAWEDAEEVECLGVGGLRQQKLLVAQSGVIELAALVESECGMQGVRRHEEDNSLPRRQGCT